MSTCVQPLLDPDLDVILTTFQIDQGVYMIRAPYLVQEVEIIKREGVFAW